MTGQWTGFVAAFLIGLVVPAVVYSDDLAEIQASFEAKVKALNALDRHAFVTSADEDVVLFGVLSPFAVEGKAAFRKAIERYVDNRKETSLSEFSIMGSTGAAWGSYRMSIRPKGSSSVLSRSRYIFTHTQTDGTWRLLTMHISPLSD